MPIPRHSLPDALRSIAELEKNQTEATSRDAISFKKDSAHRSAGLIGVWMQTPSSSRITNIVELSRATEGP